MSVHPLIKTVTERICDRSREKRRAYLERLQHLQNADKPNRAKLGCSNFAHGVAACEAHEKQRLMSDSRTGNCDCHIL